jgi:hypothetical protein
MSDFVGNGWVWFNMCNAFYGVRIKSGTVIMECGVKDTSQWELGVPQIVQLQMHSVHYQVAFEKVNFDY